MEDLFNRLLYVSDPLMLQWVAPKRMKERKRQPVHPGVLSILKHPEIDGQRLDSDTVSTFCVWPHENEVMKESQEEDGIVDPWHDEELPEAHETRAAATYDDSFSESVKAGSSNIKFVHKSDNVKRKRVKPPHHKSNPQYSALAESSTDESDTDSIPMSKGKRGKLNLVKVQQP